MATPSATLNGKRAISARAAIPAWGLWFADATLDTETTLTGAAELVIADMTLRGHILGGGPVTGAGRSQYRIVAGAGGWGRTIPEKAYTSDAGVKLSTVLSEAASAAGETLDASTVPATRVGPAFVRQEDKASTVLALEVPSNWYVGEDGITRVGKRAAVEFTGKAARGPIDKARGMLTLAPEAIAKLVPGAIVDGLEAVDVEHELSAKGGLRTTVWGKTGESSTSRRLAALRALFEELNPFLKYAGLWEYRIVTQSGERLDLQPVRVSTGMPELQRVPVRPGIPGAKAVHTLGSRVVVGFIEGPERPVVVAFEDSEGEGFSPITLSLCGGVLPAARMGDFAGPYPITATAVKVLV